MFVVQVQICPQNIGHTHTLLACVIFNISLTFDGCVTLSDIECLHGHRTLSGCLSFPLAFISCSWSRCLHLIGKDVEMVLNL